MIRCLPLPLNLRHSWQRAILPDAEAASSQRLLLINGPADPVSGRHVVTAYRSLLLEVGGNGSVEVDESDGSKFVLINPGMEVGIQVLEDAVGHYPQWEAPEQILPRIREFLLR